MVAKSNELVDAKTGEVFEGKDVAILNAGPTGVMIGGQKFDVVQQVTVPTLKHETNEVVTIRFELPIVAEAQTRESSVNVDGKKVTGTEETIINTARVTELGSGQLMAYVLNAISASELKTAYPNDSYVGKSFAIKKLGVVAGKRYKGVQIVEIQPATAV